MRDGLDGNVGGATFGEILLTQIRTLLHQAGIELSDFHARGWKSDQGGRNSMQEMHGNQTKCMEFRPIKENSNF